MPPRLSSSARTRALPLLPVRLAFTTAVVLAIAATGWWSGLIPHVLRLSMSETEPREPPVHFVPVAFSALKGWRHDAHDKAFAAFRRSCTRMINTTSTRAPLAFNVANRGPQAFKAVCAAALALGDDVSNAQARAFFEDHFTPYRVDAIKRGLLTGYFEPEVEGSREATDAYTVPVYRRPDNLVQLSPDEERAARNDEMTTGLETDGGEVVAMPDRQGIEEGALSGKGLEILYLKDPVAAYFMQVQGSGRVVLPDGTKVRIGYAGKNGHPYRSIGKYLIGKGTFDGADMSYQALLDWLHADLARAREVMWHNPSYIFFRELDETEGADGPIGAQGVALSPLRSLAVDATYHALGTPIWLSVPHLKMAGDKPFARLMIAQDVGSAIKGPERGDIYWGSGAAAGARAGRTYHRGQFTVLLPKAAQAGS